MILRPVFGRTWALVQDLYNQYVLRHYGISGEIAERRLGLDGGSLVLDVGGGTGGVSARIARNGTRAVVAEPDRYLVDHGRRKYRDVRFVRASGQALPFPDGCADAVLLIEVLHHVPDDRPVLAEAARVVRPGGRVLIEEFEFSGRLRYVAGYWMEKLLSNGVWPRTREGLCAELEALGFRAERLEDEGFVILATRLDGATPPGERAAQRDMSEADNVASRATHLPRT